MTMGLELIFFGLQPVLWLALLRTYLDSRKRIHRTRAWFHNAIYPAHFEVRQFWANLLISGLVGSAISIIAGPTVALLWIAIYQALLIVNILLIPGTVLTVELAAIAGGAAMLLDWNGSNPLGQFALPKGLGMTLGPVAPFNYVWIVSLILFLLGIIIYKDGGRYNVPMVSHNERQTRIAGYPFKTITVAPLLMFVPGDWMRQLFAGWPVFVLNGHSVAFLIIPVLLAFRMTAFKQLPRQMFKHLGKALMLLALFGVALSGLSWWLPVTSLPALAVLVLSFWWCLMRAKRADKNAGDWYSEVLDGIRVIGIEPNTPAAKMDLAIGDVILTVNHQPVTDENQFYRALQTQSTYCRMKVRNRAGRLLITESAIFRNDPHEIGVVLFKHEG